MRLTNTELSILRSVILRRGREIQERDGTTEFELACKMTGESSEYLSGLLTRMGKVENAKLYKAFNSQFRGHERKHVEFWEMWSRRAKGKQNDISNHG